MTTAEQATLAQEVHVYYHYHMEEIITIDGAGRLVVPQAMRKRLRLRKGTRLRVRDEGPNRLVLEPLLEEGVPVERDGLLVIRGQLLGGVPDHREQRAERIRRQTGADG